MTIPENFIRYCSDILGETDEGLSGSKIAYYFNQFAIEYNVEIPYPAYPFPKHLPNKRTALFSNLICFSSEQQYQIIKKLSEHTKGSKDGIATMIERLHGSYSQFSNKKNYIQKKHPISTDDYGIDNSTFQEIINIINTIGRSMEKTPSTYKGKSEEDIRDHIKIALSNRFENATITGETFNVKGKTDLLIKHPDERNIFIAELKIWNGPNAFHKAIDQLIGYLSWKDTKTALILLDQSKEPTNTLQKIKEKSKTHPNYHRKKGTTNDRSFTYEFKMQIDKSNTFLLEIMFFHFPKS